MAFPIPTVDDFKAQFTGDFPYAVPGFGAEGVAILSGGGVSSVTLAAAGQGYGQAPVVILTALPGDPGTGATATATVSNGVVTGFTVTAAGSGYLNPPLVSVTLGGGDNTNLHKVTDGDITYAINRAVMRVNPGIWPDAMSYKIAFLLCAAHFLVLALRSRMQGVRGQGGDWLVTGKSVGDVSANYDFPERIRKSLVLAPLMKTDYGCQFLELLSPYLFGGAFAAPGIARP